MGLFVTLFNEYDYILGNNICGNTTSYYQEYSKFLLLSHLFILSAGVSNQYTYSGLVVEM